MLSYRFLKHCTALALLPLSFSLCAMSKEELAEIKSDYVRPKEIPYPKDNPYNADKEYLGYLLYFDPRLSEAGTQSCATCHNPSFAWGDGMKTGTGHQHRKLGRKSPTVLNLAWSEVFMWDGRAPSLEEQALGPIQAGVEMAKDLDELIATLRSIKEYPPLFQKAFPGEKDPVSDKHLARAIATYERSIVSGIAPFDKWIEGDESAISESAKRGFVLFNDKAGCSNCHSGWNFTDDSFHDVGLPSKDIGRGKFFPNRKSMQHAFKVPGLRNITLRGPYMHDGSLADLMEVIEHYDHKFIKRPSLSDQMEELKLTKEEKQDLLEFMKTLTGKEEPVALPVLPQ